MSDLEVVDVTLLRARAASTPWAWSEALAEALRALVRAVNAGRGCIFRDRGTHTAVEPQTAAQLLCDLVLAIGRTPDGQAFIASTLRGES